MSDDPTPPDVPPPGDPNVPPADSSLPPTEPMPATPPTEPMAATPPGQPTPTSEGLAAEQAAANAERAHWYDNRAAAGAVLAIGLVGILALIGWLIWWSDDDDDDDIEAGDVTMLTVETGSTLSDDTTTTSSIPPPSIVEGERIDVTLPPTSAPTTVAPTTQPPTSPPTTAPPTTVAPTTVAPTTSPTTAPTTTSTSTPVVSVPATPGATVTDIIAASPDLSRLSAALADAGLTEALGGADAVTVFAPSDQAFETLEAAPGGAELLADPDRLAELLRRHVIGGALDSAAVLGATELETLAGDALTVDAAAQTIDGAELLVVDVQGANGFLHVVDAVLIPPPTG